MDKKMKQGKKKKKQEKFNRTMIIWIMIGIGLLYLWGVRSISLGKVPKRIGYGIFYQMVEDKGVETCTKRGDVIHGKLIDGSNYIVNIPEEGDQDLIRLLR